VPRRHGRHSTTIKLEFIRAYVNGERSYKPIANKHDISHALLMTWVEKYQAGDLSEEVDDAEKVKADGFDIDLCHSCEQSFT